MLRRVCMFSFADALALQGSSSSFVRSLTRLPSRLLFLPVDTLSACPVCLIIFHICTQQSIGVRIPPERGTRRLCMHESIIVCWLQCSPFLQSIWPAASCNMFSLTPECSHKVNSLHYRYHAPPACIQCKTRCTPVPPTCFSSCGEPDWFCTLG